MHSSLTVNSHGRVVLCLALCFLFLISSLTPIASTHRVSRSKALPQTAVRAPRRTNELLVRFRGVQSQQQKDQIAAAHGLRHKRSLGAESRIEKLQLASAADVDTAVLQLMLDPAVEFAEPNFLISHDQLSILPNDPRFDEHVWRAATYRGLTMGRSKVAEMRRTFGAPKKSEVFSEGTSNPEVWYHYDGPRDFPGTLRVVVYRSIVQRVDIVPKDLKKEEAIKHFGPDYIVTRYDFDDCLGNEESAPLFESPSGTVVFIEYRQRRIAISVNGQGNVNEISYVSEPIGAESSKCK